jgi:DNA-binding MarR family transcriptional regulator
LRIPDSQARREVHIALTRCAQQTFEALIALALERNRELVAGLSRAGIATLLASLDRLLANAKTMLVRSQGQARRC